MKVKCVWPAPLWQSRELPQKLCCLKTLGELWILNVFNSENEYVRLPETKGCFLFVFYFPSDWKTNCCEKKERKKEHSPIRTTAELSDFSKITWLFGSSRPTLIWGGKATKMIISVGTGPVIKLVFSPTAVHRKHRKDVLLTNNKAWQLNYSRNI